MSSPQRVLSGIQPTSASFHLGNYLGAVKQWVALQDDHEVFYFLADLHALTLEPPEPADLTERSRRAAAQLIAAGVDTVGLSPHLLIVPCVALVLLVLSLSGLAEGLRRALSPSGRHSPDAAHWT